MPMFVLYFLTCLMSEPTAISSARLEFGHSLKFQRLTIEEGLSQSTIRDIHQDEAGFLWLATVDGLNRYDGYRFKVYRGNADDDTSLSSSAIRALAPAGDAWMWVGTGDGLDLFDTQTEAVQHFRHDPLDPTTLGENRVTVMLVDDKKRLWVGTETGGVNLMNRKTGAFTRYYFPVPGEAEASAEIQTIMQDRAGNIWVCAENAGLWRAKPQPADQLQFEPMLPDHGVTRSVFEDSNGRIWVGTSKGFGELVDNQLKRLMLPFEKAGQPDAAVLIMYEGEKGVLWLGTAGQGLIRYHPDKGTFENYRNDPGDLRSLSEDNVLRILRDSSGLIWVGTFVGLNKVDPDHELFTLTPGGTGRRGGLLGNYVLGVREDSKDLLWVGTERALTCFDRKRSQTTYYRHNPKDPSSLSPGRVRSVYEDKQGVIWVGTEGGGLNRMEGERFVHYRREIGNPNALVDDSVRIVMGDDAGNLWIGCIDGLSRLSPDRTRFQNFKRIPGRSDSLTHNFILAIYPDGNQIWVASSRGLNRLDLETGRIKRFLRDPDNPTSLSDNGTSTVYKDKDGMLWVGTLGGGLNRLDPDREGGGFFRRYTTADGLANNTVYGILGDDNGALWVSTNMGLSRFNPVDETFRNFTAEDGLQSNEFNTGAYFRNDRGELFFGGINGFNSFFPDRIQTSDYSPYIQLTDLEVFGKEGLKPYPSATTERVVMTPSDYFVSVEFAALDLTAPKKNRYAYRLEGLHDQWIEINRNELVLSKPEPGLYTLRVKGSNHDGIWSGNETQLILVAPTPVWRTNWALVLYVLLTCLLIFAGYRFRLQRIRARERELEELVDQRTGELLDTRQELLDAAHRAGMAEVATNVLHEIGNTLNSINISADLIEESINKDNPVRLLQRIGDIMADPVKQIDNNQGQISHTLQKVTSKLRTNRGKLGGEMARLRKDLNTIIKIIRDQHKHTHFAEHLEIMDIGDLIHTVIEGLRKELTSDNVGLIESLSATKPVKVNKNKMMRVLVNLLGNAGDAVRQIEGTRRVEIITHMDTDAAVRIEVVDNGIGIPADRLTKIFTHGYTTKRSGNGFGLHYCANAVSEMGGKLHVESDGPNQGARFIITLPAELT